MYAVEVRDRIMIAPLAARSVLRARTAHARRDVRGRRRLLPREADQAERRGRHRRGADRAQRDLKPLDYQNLDMLPEFKGKLTTTEFLCKHVFDAMAKAARERRARRRRQGPREDPRHPARDRPRARHRSKARSL